MSYDKSYKIMHGESINDGLIKTFRGYMAQVEAGEMTAHEAYYRFVGGIGFHDKMRETPAEARRAARRGQ